MDVLLVAGRIFLAAFLGAIIGFEKKLQSVKLRNKENKINSK